MSPSLAAPGNASHFGVRSAFLWGAGVTLAIGLFAQISEPSAAGTLITLTFFAAVWFAVWRYDDNVLRMHGLTLGGLMGGGGDVIRSWSRALAWSLGTSAVVLLPFALLWRPVMVGILHAPLHDFAAHKTAVAWASLAATHLLVVALPEEAFYRGVLQTRFETRFPGGLPLLGANVSLGNVMTSAIFALGHLATLRHPQHLLVFFPSLLFGWLRTRTKGIEAGLLFHAFCNLLSNALEDGYLAR